MKTDDPNGNVRNRSNLFSNLIILNVKITEKISILSQKHYAQVTTPKCIYNKYLHVYLMIIKVKTQRI